MPSFKDFSLLDSLKLTLKEKGLNTPTEIQTKAIPALLEGQSLIGVAETGSGKTLAYVLPILSLLKQKENAGDRVSEESQPRALVVVPSRELGEQVSKVFKIFTHTTRLRVRTVLGGTKIQVAKENVKGSFEILVATPGRLVQMITRKQVSLANAGILIFDEVDQMIDPGFLADATNIMRACSEPLQVGLFSATVSTEVEAMICDMVPNTEVFRTAGASRVVAKLKTDNKIVVDGKRLPILENLMAHDQDGGTLIFTNTREQCDKLAAELDAKGFECAIYRGEMDKIERRANLKAFRDGKIKYLISTDLASRGLDVDHVGRVINYHMPKVIENYLHRAGRTARAGRSGVVINFVTERDQEIMKEIQTKANRN